MDPSPVTYNAVYHVAAINHWEAVVREQAPSLLANRNVSN